MDSKIYGSFPMELVIINLIKFDELELTSYSCKSNKNVTQSKNKNKNVAMKYGLDLHLMF